MNKRHSPHWIAAAVVTPLAIMLFCAPAGAQLPANGQDGHATDANNRVGSNGYNGLRPSGPAVTGNQIVTRDVTDLKAFQGPIPYRDTGAFTGPVGGKLMDAFVRNSSGAPSPYAAPSSLSQPLPFYGERRGIAPPAGSLPEGFNGGYIGSNLMSPSTLSNTLNNSPAAYSLQSRTLTRDTLDLNSQLNPESYPLASPNEPMNTQMYNPTLVRSTWESAQQPINQQPGMGNSQMNQGQPNGAGANGPETAVQQMQRELLEAAGLHTAAAAQPTIGPGQQNQTGNAGSTNSNAAPSNQSQPLNNSMQPASQSPVPNPNTSNSINSTPLNTNMNAQQAYRDALQAPAPALQSPQLAELQRRLERYTSSTPPTDAEAKEAFAAQRRRAEALAGSIRQPVPLTPGTLTPGPSMPLVPRGAQPPVDNTPLVIHSLAEGIKARGLHDLLASAEDLMRQDKFESAIEQYDQAARVAPNNALIPLGRAVAELGAGFYAQADRDLRIVYRVAPELLGGRVDLASMLSAQRLEFLRKDLNTLTLTDTKSQRPWFLLAFLAYNTADAVEAQKDLSEAESRGSQLDWTIRRLKERWDLQSSINNALNPPTTKPAQP